MFCLMNEGADWRAVDAVGDTVLHFACIKEVPCGRHDQTLEYLMSTPARTLKDSCNKRGDTPIFLAARHVYGQVWCVLGLSLLPLLWARTLQIVHTMSVH